jgi:large subunit ribosomal protein L15
MKVHDLKPAPGSRTPKRRVGRGIGGRGGKTAGRGMKGQGARDTVPVGFEGGQTPVMRRTPKAKGFRNPFRVEYHVVNLDTLAGFADGDTVDPDTLRGRGLVAKRGLVKILGRGDLEGRRLTVRAHGFSASARAAIEAAGGSTETLAPPWGDRRPPHGSNNALTNR